MSFQQKAEEADMVVSALETARRLAKLTEQPVAVLDAITEAKFTAQDVARKNHMAAVNEDIR